MHMYVDIVSIYNYDQRVCSYHKKISFKISEIYQSQGG